jgi:hypothetical protein
VTSAADSAATDESSAFRAIVEVWSESGIRCMLHPHVGVWELALHRDHQIVKSDRFVDATLALVAADDWRTRYSTIARRDYERFLPDQNDFVQE